MKRKSGFMLRKMAGEFLALPFDGQYDEVGAIVSLNESGAFLWNCLENECSDECLKSALVRGYEITGDEAAAAVEAFVGRLREARLLDE